MTKQEEVDKILTKYTFRTAMHLDEVKRELLEAGVVIKVDRELPLLDCYSAYPTVVEKVQQDMLKAGYVPVEPLIKEE